MKIETFQYNDISSLKEIQPNGWDNICPIFDFYFHSDFCFPIKVITEEKIVGIGTLIVHSDVAWLAHIIVHKEYRKQGIGTLITNHLVNMANKAKHDPVYLIATEMGAPLYEKVGFVTETEYLFFKNIDFGKSNMGFPENITPFSEKYMDTLKEMDARVSQERRWCHIENFLDTGLLYILGEVVQGFYLPLFGDGFIVADTDEAGLALMKARLRNKTNASFPQENVAAAKLLRDKGFTEVKRAKRMRMGKSRDVLFSNIYNRVAGKIG